MTWRAVSLCGVALAGTAVAAAWSAGATSGGHLLLLAAGASLALWAATREG